MTVVIRGLDTRAVFQVATVMMRRQARTQRPEDEEQSAGHESIGVGASHAASSPKTTDGASEPRSGRRGKHQGSATIDKTESSWRLLIQRAVGRWPHSCRRLHVQRLGEDSFRSPQSLGQLTPRPEVIGAIHVGCVAGRVDFDARHGTR